MKGFVASALLVLASSGSGFRLDSRVPLSRVPNTCVTQSGTNCVFPFKYKVSSLGVNNSLIYSESCLNVSITIDQWEMTAIMTELWPNGHHH